MDLPRDETPFFGRQAEIADVGKRVDGGARLVTIVGLGGMGKTRLSIELAASLRPRFEKYGGVAFATLAQARTLEAAVREVAATVGARVAPESKAAKGVAALGEALAARGKMLLVLDNVEQLGEIARDLVNGLLDGARELVLIVTSREPVGARGEEKVMLTPLADEAARELFVDRARLAAGGAVEVSEAEAKAIVERVDRIPLAIELAASRLELLSASELLARVGAKLDVLADASSSRTLRGTLDLSWELLGDVERKLLAQAAVFAGPFGVDAAEEVLVAPGVEVLDVLEGLLRKSLLVRAEGPARDGQGSRARLRMYGTVRAWAREKLDASDDANGGAEVRARHARFYLGEAEQWAGRAYGAEGARALDALAEMLPELMAAFESTNQREPATAARIVMALSDLLLFRGLFELRAELFASAAEAAERAGDERLLARALVAKARVTLEVGRMGDAETELRRALDLATRAKDDTTKAEATRSLGWALTATSRFDEAEKLVLEAQSMHREQGSARGEADTYVALGIVRAFQGRRDEALAHLQSALAIHVEQGDVVRQEKVLGFATLVGQEPREVARGLPREVLARAPAASLHLLPNHIAEAASVHRDAGERWRSAIDLYLAGASAHARGEATAAVESFERALGALKRAGVTRGTAAIHAHTALALAESGEFAEADARLTWARAGAKTDAASEFAVDVLGAAVEAARAKDAPDADKQTLLARARATLERATRAEGATPEVAHARKALERALERAAGGSAATRPAGAPGLVIGRDARWMIAQGGERTDLVRYGPVRRLLDRLVGARLESPGVALSAEALIEAGWPGERMRHTAGLLRTYSAVRRLRRLGLEGVLVTRDDGYLLDPNVVVARDDA